MQKAVGDYFTAKELAEYLGKSPRQVYDIWKYFVWEGIRYDGVMTVCYSDWKKAYDNDILNVEKTVVESMLYAFPALKQKPAPTPSPAIEKQPDPSKEQINKSAKIKKREVTAKAHIEEIWREVKKPKYEQDKAKKRALAALEIIGESLIKESMLVDDSIYPITGHSKAKSEFKRRLFRKVQNDKPN